MENSNKILITGIIVLVFLVSLTSFSQAKTTCQTQDCGVIITLHIAFSGADNATIDKWKTDIEKVWNGYTYGACGCKATFKVDAISVTSCNNVSEYHCINVTKDHPKTSDNVSHRGFMSAVAQKGQSLLGWWSLDINAPYPKEQGYTEEFQGDIHDAAHEAGHMLGLGDEYIQATNVSNGTYADNIMGKTWSDKAKPTQEQIDSIIAKNCGSSDCPKKCCCGNGKIDTSQGEQCDPAAKPIGCNAGELCVSCKCYSITPAVCGNGKLEGTEECDYYATNTTCNSTQECNTKCKCVAKINQTGGGGEFKITITDPSDGDTIDDVVYVKVNVTGNESKIEKVKFYMNSTTTYTDTEEPYKWQLDNTEFAEGWWILKAKVYDMNGNTKEDTIDIKIKH